MALRTERDDNNLAPRGTDSEPKSERWEGGGSFEKLLILHQHTSEYFRMYFWDIKECACC